MATLGCIKAKMGRTTYYICKMAAGELIDRVGIAKELPEWPDMTAEEKMQRECDIKRIVEEIVPYVIEDPGSSQVSSWISTPALKISASSPSPKLLAIFRMLMLCQWQTWASSLSPAKSGS